MNENVIGFASDFTFDSTVMKYEITNDNKLRLYVEDYARALGVVKKSTLKSSEVSETIRWDRVYDDLVGIERIPTLGNFKNLENDRRKELRAEMKDMTISETELYLWSFRTDGEKAKEFRKWIAEIVLPHLREYGIYLDGMENMDSIEVANAIDDARDNFVLRKFGINIRKKLTNAIRDVIQPKPNQSYVYAIYTNIIYNIIFGMDCKECKEQLGLEKKHSLRDDIRDSDEYVLLDDIAKIEDVMSNFMLSGVTDVALLSNMISQWYINFKKSEQRQQQIEEINKKYKLSI